MPSRAAPLRDRAWRERHRAIRRASSPARTCSTSRSRSRTSRCAAASPRPRCRRPLERVRTVLFEARSRRPRPHLDDKVLTAWNGLMIAALARAARVLPDSPHAGRLHERPRSRRQPSSSRRCGDRATRSCCAATAPATRRSTVCRGLLVPDRGAARAAAGDRRCGMARMGDRAAAAAGRAVLGRQGRRVVQHHRPGSHRAAAAEGGLRRRRAVREFGRGPQRPDTRASDRRRRLSRQGGADAAALRSPRRGRRARHPDDAVRAVAVARAVDADRGRRRTDVRLRSRNSSAKSRRTTCRLPSTCRLDPDANQEALRTRLPFVDGMQAHGGGAVYVCRDFTCRQPVSSADALRGELQ